MSRIAQGFVILALTFWGCFAYSSAPLCGDVFQSPRKALFLDDEIEVGSARLHFTQNEKSSIDASFYQMDGNKVGQVAFAELIDAARRGVKVRLLLDSWNPEDWIDTRVKPRMFKALLDAGVDVRIFNPVDPKKIITYFASSNFNRMHDKLMIYGGQQVVATGDRNMQNSNFRIQKRKGMNGLSYRSVEMVVKDEAMTKEAQDYFLKMWEFGETPDTSMVSLAESKNMQRHLDQVLSIIRSKDLGKKDWTSRMTDVEHIRFLRDVPGVKVQTYGIADGILETLQSAQKSITIYSPYLYLTPRFLSTIKAARARNVEVTFILPSWQSIDTPFTMQHFEKQAQQMQALGVKVIQHTGADFMHAKMAIIDSESVFVGSYNFNPRSENTDYETGFVVKDKNFAKEVVDFDRKFQQLESAPFEPSKKNLLTSMKISFIRFFVRVIPLLRNQI